MRKIKIQLGMFEGTIDVEDAAYEKYFKDNDLLTALDLLLHYKHIDDVSLVRLVRVCVNEGLFTGWSEITSCFKYSSGFGNAVSSEDLSSPQSGQINSAAPNNTSIARYTDTSTLSLQMLSILDVLKDSPHRWYSATEVFVVLRPLNMFTDVNIHSVHTYLDSFLDSLYNRNYILERYFAQDDTYYRY